MSITSAISSAMSGLAANARQLDAVASNLANATTPGYAARTVQLASGTVSGQGVRILGTERRVDQILLSETRLSRAALAESQYEAGFLGRMEALIGGDGAGSGIADRIIALDAALISASAQPQSEPGLRAVLDAAADLVRGITQASTSLQQERLDADRAIASRISGLQQALAGIEALNGQIAGHAGGNIDISALLDQRQQLIDSVAQQIPLREVPRENGRVALVSAGGLILLDGQAPEFEFTSVQAMVPEMTLASGALSGLSLNGRPVDASLLAGGELAALFHVRDGLAPDLQASLDGLARDLIERFSQPSLDPSLTGGLPGVFTDAGQSFDPLREAGVASRLHVNALIDPAQGGQLSRLRDGIQTTAVGATGQSALLSRMSGAISDLWPTGSAAFASGQRSLTGLAGDLLSALSHARLGADARAARAEASLSVLTDRAASFGVNSDAELQALLVLEKTYAANARVLSAADEMLRALLEL